MSRPNPRRGAPLPYRTLAGVVPSPAGWLAATAKLQGITMAPEEPQVFASVLDVLDYKPAFEVVALFSPIGLLEDPTPHGRRCEREARKILGWPRSGAITSAPARRALGFETYADAAVANGGGLSAIGWRVIKRVEEGE